MFNTKTLKPGDEVASLLGTTYRVYKVRRVGVNGSVMTEDGSWWKPSGERLQGSSWETLYPMTDEIRAILYRRALIESLRGHLRASSWENFPVATLERIREAIGITEPA